MSEVDLFHAVLERDVAKVKSLWKAGVNPDFYIDEDERTPLYLAAQFDQIDIVATLIDAGACIEVMTSTGYTPLIAAAENGHCGTVLLLISAGANVNQFTHNGTTPLILAARNGHADMVLALISSGANINQENIFGWTPLYDAARNGHEKVVSILISAGANLTQDTNGQETPLMAARKLGRIKVTRILEKAYIFHAARYGDKTSLRSLLQNDQQLDSIENEDGYTPLYIAAQHGHDNIVAMLIATGSNVNQTFTNGETPLCIAAENGHEDVVSTLLFAGANIHQAKSNGATALCVAAEKGHIKVVQRLVSDQCFKQSNKKGWVTIITTPFNGSKSNMSKPISPTMNCNEAMADGNTPLHLASANGHHSIVELLISAGANVSQTNQNGWTPLFSAASNHHIDIVSTLILAGSNINHIAQVRNFSSTNQASSNGQTALYASAENGCTDIIWTLLLAKADPNIQANNGMTPLTIANKNGHEEAARLLSPEGLLKVEIIDTIRCGNINQLQSLMTKVGNPNVIVMNGNSLLHAAIHYNQPQVLEMLLHIPNVQLNPRNKNNETPLTFAIKSGSQLVNVIFGVVHMPMEYIKRSELDIDSAKRLGSGGFGVVYKGKYKNQVVAVKKIHANISFHALQKEISAMQLCRSPYVLRLIAVCDLNTNSPKLVLEYMDGGDLRSYLDKKQSNSLTNPNYSTMEIAWVIANGLADIHRNGYIHRDLKSHNILLSTEHYIKIADLGLTRDAFNTKTEGVGTFCWTAPEVYTSSNYGYSADIYSFGIILTELDTLNAPYHDLHITPHSLFNQICNGSLRPSISANCDQWYKTLVDDCLAHDPKKRPTAIDIVGILRTKLLKKECTKKVRATEALAQPTTPLAKHSSPSYTTPIQVLFRSITGSKVSNALGCAEVRCKRCKAANSILNEFCTKCVKPLVTTQTKVKILIKRLEKARIRPSWRCPVCDERCEVKLTHCTTCDNEMPELDKINNLVALLTASIPP